MKFVTFLLVFIFTTSFIFVTTSQAEKMGQIAIFTEAVGWTDVATANAQAQIIIDGLKLTKDIQKLGDAAIGDWAKKNTKDGDTDVIIMFGYFPVSQYTPGNGQRDGSVGELFLEGGNMFLNSCDYIFYVTQGGGVNAATGLQNMTDTTFDCWTDGNTCKPTDDGKKYTPSLPASFSAPRCFRKTQIDANPDWSVEVAFGSNGADNLDPAIIKNKVYGGRVGIVHQVSDNSMPRGKVMLEMLDNWLSKQVKGVAVDSAGKLSTAWGEIRLGF
jgi:hypothetical protein